MQTPRRKSEEKIQIKRDPCLTAEKLNALKSELEKLKKMHPFAAEEVKRLAQLGDFSENAEYQIAKGHLRGINRRILELETQIKNAIIIDPSKNSDVVRLGNTVELEYGGKKYTYLILGSTEADPLKGIISQNSPLGAALIGQKAGDTVNIGLKDKKIEYKIIKIL